MKKLLVFAAIAMLACSAMAATGWFNDFLLVSVNGGADQSKWIGTDPGSGSAFAGSTFTITLGQTVELGANMSYWSDTQDRTGGAFYWTTDNYVTQNEVIWTQSGPTGNDYLGSLASTVNVASGLGVGSHTIAVWAKSWGGAQGDSWLTQAGNYTATIQVNQAIPEPATMSLLGLGALAMVLRRKIRK
jgi:hypothetical protein